MVQTDGSRGLKVRIINKGVEFIIGDKFDKIIIKGRLKLNSKQLQLSRSLRFIEKDFIIQSFIWFYSIKIALSKKPKKKEFILFIPLIKKICFFLKKKLI